MEIHPIIDPIYAENAQRQNAERLTLTLDATNQGAWDWDIASGKVVFTPRCYMMLGYEPDEFPQTYSAWCAIIHPSDIDRFETMLHLHLEKGGDYTVEMRFKTKTGAWCWIMSRGMVVERDGEGRAVRMVGILTDINKRKQLEERLQKEIERGKRLLVLYEQAPRLTESELYSYILDQAIALTDSSIGFFHLVSADQTHIDLTTWNQNALNQCMIPQETHYPIDQAGNWVDCVRQKRPLIYNEFPASPNQKGLPDGHTAVKRLLSIPVMEGDRVRIIFGVGNKTEPYDEQDVTQIQLVANELQKITRQRHADEEIRTLNQDLERRVTERTAQLEAANRELESFAYTISHDLRAPLRHIHGFVELLSAESSFLMNETTREYMKIITTSTKQMGTLIDDLLTFTHLGRKEIVKVRVDMNELVREAVRELKQETTGRSILWQIADLPEVSGDRAMLQLAVVNLISNAIKFTRPCPEARIEIGCGEESCGERAFYVRDNGAGFDMQYAGKLFGVFQRLHRVSDFEGNGIGLAVVRRIVQRHGGRTWAEAKVDQGATFSFTLPI